MFNVLCIYNFSNVHVFTRDVGKMSQIQVSVWQCGSVAPPLKFLAVIGPHKIPSCDWPAQKQLYSVLCTMWLAKSW